MRLATVEIPRDRYTRALMEPRYTGPGEDKYEEEDRKPMHQLGVFQYDPDRMAPSLATATLITAMQNSLAAQITAMTLEIQRLEHFRNNLYQLQSYIEYMEEE
jgi:hypothetical protein